MAQVQTPPGPSDERAQDIVAEIERSIVGGLLLDPARFAEVAELVGPGDFRDALYGAVFAAIGRLVKAGGEVDSLLVQEQLVRDGHDEYGDRETRVHLADVVANTPSAANVVAYARRLVEHRDQAFNAWRAEQSAGTQDPERVERGGRLFDRRSGQPVVRWREGFIHDVVDQAEAALIEANLGIFQRERMLVRVSRRKEPSIRNYERPPGVLGIQMVTAPYLTEAFARAAIFEKFDGKARKWRRVNPPDKIALTYLERSSEWKVPLLWDTISAPTLRPDGSIIQEPGYDEAMHVFYDPCGVAFPRIPDRPTDADARRAFALLREAFGTFPYVDETDRAVALSGVLTSVVRRSLPAAPLIGISAPTANSGKTLIAEAIGIVGMGSKPAVMTLAKTDEEAQKTALSVLLESDPVVLIDNVSRPLEGDWLCSVITSETYRQRVLGRTEMATVPTRILWLATGNGFRVAGDMRTRTLLCRIDAKVENPGERVFSGDFRKEITAQRPELVTAALTLMRAFIVTGQRADEHVANWGRFEQWSEMVRAPLVWMGAADPCDSIRTLQQLDPVRGEHLRVLSAWWDCFADEERTAREVMDELKSDVKNNPAQRLYAELVECAAGRDGQVTARSLGRWLEKRIDAPVGGLTVMRCAERDHAAVWKVAKEAKPE